MPDMEKVIKGLECCSSEEDKCLVCPYYSVCYVTQQFSFRAIFADAIALLKAQEPIAPEPTTDNDWVCGNCAESLVGYSELDAGGFVTYRFSYCPNCGRAVKWE